MDNVILYFMAFGGLVVSAAVAFGLSPLLRVWAFRQRWVDVPDKERKKHHGPVPCIGGLAIACGVTAGLLYFTLLQKHFPFDASFPLAVWLGSIALLVTGLYDDIHGLGFKRKFLIQVTVAYLMIWAGFRIDLSFLPFLAGDASQEMLVSLPLTLLWIVGIINAVNMIDGMDGLAAGVVVIAFISLGVVFSLQGDLSLIVLSLAVVGAAAGFLVHNFSPASIFMGDSGSMVLGFLLAIYGIQGTGHVDPLWALLIPAIALGLPIADTLLSIARRLLARQSPFLPDNDHIHHRLLARYGRHRTAVLVLYGVSAAFGLAAFMLSVTEVSYGWVVLGLTVLCAYLFVRNLGYLHVRETFHTVQLRVDEYLLERQQTEKPLEPDAGEVAVRGDGYQRALEV